MDQTPQNKDSSVDLTKIALASTSVSTQELEHQVEEKLHGYEDKFREKAPTLWWLTFMAPFLLVVVVLVLLLLYRGIEFSIKVSVVSVVTFFGLGRFVILFGDRGAEQIGEAASRFSFMTPWELFLMVSFMDLVTAMLVAFHIGALFRIPVIGTRVVSLVEDARFVLSKMPWMERLTFTGLTVFIAFPLASTGAIGGAILGTLLGLSRKKVFVGTMLGCLVGNGVLLVASEQIARFDLMNNPVVRWGGLAVIVSLIVFMEVRYRRSKKKFASSHA
ncbi:MAG: small multi-drug export protein [Pirellulaceae bacterium]|nr:small multi-drug export protein [Pirellulaceae bacterium]